MSTAASEAFQATTTDTPLSSPVTSNRVMDRQYRLSVEKYDQMAEAGILTKRDRVELLEGLLVHKMTRNERHLTTTWLIQQALIRVLPQGYFLGKEDPLVLPRSVPEPDLMILRGTVQDYFRRKPGSADALLVVEVADSSYADDVNKLELYAEARIPFCWIAHLPARRIEVYSDPTGPDARPTYRMRRDHDMEEAVPLIIDGHELARFPVADLLASVAGE